MKAFQIILACVNVIACVLLVLSVLFQNGSKQGLGAIGGAAETFAEKGKGDKINRKLRTMTIIVSIVFIVVCIALNIISLATK